MGNYSEKLKNPKWQRKRLEIMQRDNFECHICGNSKETLNVHHLYYDKGKDVWDYPNEALITLCESCHESMHQNNMNIVKQCADLIFITFVVSPDDSFRSQLMSEYFVNAFVDGDLELFKLLIRICILYPEPEEIISYWKNYNAENI